MGFGNVVFQQGSTVVLSADPATVPGAILTQAAEANGRPVSFVLLAADVAGAPGTWIELDEPTLRKTLNWRLLETGVAYYTVYTSTPHRDLLREAAASARSAALGVWPLDRTAGFVLDGQESIGRGGQLILPKLFRRATDYLKAVAGGFAGNLSDWIVSVSASSSRSENDRVVLADGAEVDLSSLIQQQNRTVVLQPDLLDIVFVEK